MERAKSHVVMASYLDPREMNPLLVCFIMTFLFDDLDGIGYLNILNFFFVFRSLKSLLPVILEQGWAIVLACGAHRGHGS